MSSFVGVDVAKNTFDIATHLPNGKHKTKAKLANDPKGFKEFEAWLQKQVEPSALIVMEATSVYHLELARVRLQQRLSGLCGQSGHDPCLRWQ